MPNRDPLADALMRVVPSDLAPSPSIVFCDRDNDGRFHRFAGLARVRMELKSGHQQNGAYRSILVLGLFPVNMNGTSPQEKELAALLRWPGIVYLPYGFTKEHLIAAARKAVEGAKVSMPPGALLPTTEDIHRVVSEIRHWLENRLRNTKGMLIDCRNAAKGDMQLHPAYLEPTTAISQAHRQMLDRLWALEAAIELYAPLIGGLAPMKAAVAQFEAYWQELEAMRAEIRSRDGEECAKLLSKASQQLEHACSALVAAIDATNILSRAMSARGEC